MPNVLVSPKNTRIIGTCETIPGCAIIQDPKLAEDGRFEFEYSGETKCYWNGQNTIELNGERVFQDDLGNEFVESQLRVMSEEEFEALEKKRAEALRSAVAIEI